MRIYAPCSKQHKAYLKYALEEIEGKFEMLFPDRTVDVRAFEGGHYPGASQTVGGAEVAIIVVEEFYNFVGKGVYTEYEYARKNSIPVFMINKDGDFALPTKVEEIDEADWRQYAKFTFRSGMRSKDISHILDTFGTIGTDARKQKVSISDGLFVIGDRNTSLDLGEGLLARIEDKYPEETLLLRR